MANRHREVVVSFVILLGVLSCTVILFESSNAQISSNKLESVATRANDLEGSAQVTVGKNPASIDLYEIGDIYVANQDSNNVSVIDRTTNTVIKNIPVQEHPTDLAAGRDYVYVSNTGSGSVSVIDPATRKVNSTIHVGDGPLELLSYGGYIYVANRDSDFVSVINTTTNRVNASIYLSNGIKHMVGESDFLGKSDYIYFSHSGGISKIDPTTNKVELTIPVLDASVEKLIAEYSYEDNKPYIYATFSNYTISKIDPTTNKVNRTISIGDYIGGIDVYDNYLYVTIPNRNAVYVIDHNTGVFKKNLTVGYSPFFIVNYEGEYLYVANIDSNTVSVIDPHTHTVNSTIPVGDLDVTPSEYIYPGSDEIDAVYVANARSGTISVIDKETNNVVAGVKFEISPGNTGRIICNGLDVPLNLYLYVSSGTHCLAKANAGFEFSSWVETIGNSTRIINTTSANSPWSSFLDVLGIKFDDPTATLNVNKFGYFTASFKALPPPVPPEYWTSLFGVIATALVGSLLIPVIITWFKSRKQTSRLKSFHGQMASVYEDRRLDENDMPLLNSLNKNISDSYVAGQINNEQYTNLKNEVSIAYEEIFKGRINALDKPSYSVINRGGTLAEIKEDISDAYSKGKITKLHYDLLSEKISKLTTNDSSK